ncbi:MAG: deoxyhypusine synthase [Methanosarcinales archaeon]|nr:deoxyhypusine synthase [ANME-2 cluster archaeon]MDW7776530.1 deoxyhypusine synthase [Methanosarcinales archaeon]
MNKEQFTHHPTVPMDVTDRTVSEITRAMTQTGFQGRKLGESVEAWVHMLQDDEVTIMMGLSGAMVPAGMRGIITHLIKHRMIDCLVSTGANIFHDIHESLNRKHYLGTHLANDETLFSHGIDRIHDVFAVEEEFREADRLIGNFGASLDNGRTYSSREFISLLGARVKELGGRIDSIIVSAYEHNVPIFIPALTDSSIGIGLVYARRQGHELIVDQIKDADEITQIVEQSKKTGVIYVGGGVPKNFIQQTEVIASLMGGDVEGHDYAIQYTTDAPHWGGLSGCTFDEAVSWGKIAGGARKVQVFVDATIALPIVAHALRERMDGVERRGPVFEWSENGLKVRYG